MLSKLQHRMNSEEKGFTLIELLVVILIIGILAAIALPAFLGQRSKAQDSSAKSDARNMVSQVESCFTDTQDYAQCDTPTDGTALRDGTKTGLPTTIKVTPSAASNAQGYTIEAQSKSGKYFYIKKADDGTTTRYYAGAAGAGSGTAW